jgi:hypothetical protein
LSQKQKGDNNMMTKSIMKFSPTLFLILLFMIVFLIQSCSGTSKNRRGKLSDAVEKASDDHDDNREVKTEPDPNEDEDEDYEDLYYIEESVEPSHYVENDSLTNEKLAKESGRNPWWLLVSGGTGFLESTEFYGLNHFNLGVGGYNQSGHHFLNLSAGFGWSPVQETSILNASLDGGINLLNIGLGYKYFVTSSHTLMGFYLSFGIHYNYMFWSYKNSIEAMAYDEYGNEIGMETISSDGLPGFEFYFGIGLNIIQSEGIQLGIEGSPGLILWLPETSEGFDNDVFGTFYYIKLKVVLSFRI